MLQETALRDRAVNAPLRPSTRNPFRFAKRISPEAPRPSALVPSAVPSTPAPPPPPSLSLSGIADRKTPEGRKRTAIISGEGQVYLAAEGDSVAGRYHVVTVDSDAVTLRDDDGTETRLILH